MKNCCKCKIEIPAERLEAIPDTTTCVNCSNVKKKVGFMDFYHKTAPELVIVDSSDEESVRRARRVYNRSR